MGSYRDERRTLKAHFNPAQPGMLWRSAAVLKASRSNVRNTVRRGQTGSCLAGSIAAAGLRHSRVPDLKKFVSHPLQGLSLRRPSRNY